MTSHEELQKYLEEINEVIAIQMQNQPPGLGFESTCFARVVIDKLLNQGNFYFPSEEKENCFNLIDRFEGIYDKRRMRMDGCMILPNGNGDYDVHLFVTDYERRTQLESITQQEIDKIAQEAYWFVKNAGDENFKNRLSLERAACDVSAQIVKFKERVNSVYIWVISNRYRPDDCNARRNIDLWGRPTEFIRRIIDLGYLKDGDLEKAHNVLNFESIGGLDALKISVEKNAGFECYLSSIPADYLVQIYSAYGTSLIEKNLRAYLGGKNKTNSGIVETISTDPINFVALNNGLVMIAEKVAFSKGKLLKLKNFQIVNGGQTTATLYYTYKAAGRKKNAEEGNRIKKNFEKILVPLKIVTITNEENSESPDGLNFAAKIAIAANSQSAIKASDLSASVKYYQEFEKMCKDLIPPRGGRWFFERARGSYGAEEEKFKGDRKGKKAFQTNFPKDKVFNKTDLGLTALTWECQPVQACKGAQGAFGIFNQGVREKVPTVEEVKVLICQWLILNRLEKKLKTEKQKNPRTAAVYTIYLFSKWYGARIDWEKLWNFQDVPESIMNPLFELALNVDRVIRANMGNQIINMYGRREECRLVVDSVNPALKNAFLNSPYILQDHGQQNF